MRILVIALVIFILRVPSCGGNGGETQKIPDQISQECFACSDRIMCVDVGPDETKADYYNLCESK